MRKYLSEFIGTFFIVLCGTGTMVLDQHTGGGVSPFGISLTFGVGVTLMILVFNKSSGAHFNPAVTLGFSMVGLFPKKEILPYIISQLFGAIAASILLRFLFPANENLGATLPLGSEGQSFFLELVLTFLLMWIVLWFSQTTKLMPFTALAIGLTVGLEAYFGGPISGASMNPARSIAPAIVSGHLESLWVYISAPILGTVIAVVGWKYPSVFDGF